MSNKNFPPTNFHVKWQIRTVYLVYFFPFIWSKPSADRWALPLKILKAFSRVCSGLQWTDFICSRAALSGCLSQPHSPRCTAPLCLFVLFLLLSLKRDKQTNKPHPHHSQNSFSHQARNNQFLEDDFQCLLFFYLGKVSQKKCEKVWWFAKPGG